MTNTIVARVRRVLSGGADRALIVAVDQAGLEYKIEAPLETVRNIREPGEHVLMLTWSLLALPPGPQPHVTAQPSSPAQSVGAPPTITSASTERPSPSIVDQQFMDLLGRLASTTTSDSASHTTQPGQGPPLRPEQQLAALLGIGASRPPS